MTTLKKVEDLTLYDIKEQMALYQRLYYHRTKNYPETKANKDEERVNGTVQQKKGRETEGEGRKAK